jgi:hypothetical protein
VRTEPLQKRPVIRRTSGQAGRQQCPQLVFLTDQEASLGRPADIASDPAIEHVTAARVATDPSLQARDKRPAARAA